MEIKDFNDFSSRLVSSTVMVSPISFRPEEANRLPDYLRLLLGDYTDFSFPIVFKQEDGKKWQDLLDIGYPNLFLISEKMKTVLEVHHFTGWKTFDVQVFDKRGYEIKGYYGFSVIGRCGLIDYKKSEIIEKQYVENGPIVKFYKGLYVGLDQWDGSDFFLPERYYGIIITRKVADVLKQNKITNIYSCSLLDIETDVDFAPRYD